MQVYFQDLVYELYSGVGAGVGTHPGAIPGIGAYLNILYFITTAYSKY